MMLILDLLDEIRTELDDTNDAAAPAGYAYAWQASDIDLLWKNVQLVRYLNWAITEIGIRNPILDDATSWITRLPVPAGAANVAYSSLVETIESVYLESTGRPLIKTTRGAKEAANVRGTYYTGVDWRDESGAVTEYLEDTRQRTLRLWRTPSATDTLRLVVHRRFDDEVRWSDLANESAPSTCFNELPDDYREALLFGVLMQAFRKRDSDSYNDNAAQTYTARFDALAGPPVTLHERETRRRMANLDVSIIPHGYVPRVRHGRSYYGQTTDPDF